MQLRENIRVRRNRVDIAKLNLRAITRYNEPAKVAGWGLTENGLPSPRLKKLDVQTFNHRIEYWKCPRDYLKRDDIFCGHTNFNNNAGTAQVREPEYQKK